VCVCPCPLTVRIGPNIHRLAADTLLHVTNDTLGGTSKRYLFLHASIKRASFVPNENPSGPPVFCDSVSVRGVSFTRRRRNKKTPPSPRTTRAATKLRRLRRALEWDPRYEWTVVGGGGEKIIIKNSYPWRADGVCTRVYATTIYTRNRSSLTPRVRTFSLVHRRRETFRLFYSA